MAHWWLIHTTRARTGTGSGMGTIESNGSLSLCSVYSTWDNIETHCFLVPVPCSVNEPKEYREGLSWMSHNTEWFRDRYRDQIESIVPYGNVHTVSLVRDRDSKECRSTVWGQQRACNVILIISWETGTRTYCFLLCQPNSLYQFRSRSRTVWIYHKYQSNTDDNCAFARGRATDRAKLCTWAVQKRKQAWKLRKTLVTLLQTDVDRQMNAIRPLVSSSLKSSEDDVLLNTYIVLKPKLTVSIST